MVQHAGKLKEANWINIWKMAKNKQIQNIRVWNIDAPVSIYLLTSHVTEADSGLCCLVSCRLLGQHLFGSIELSLGATGAVDLRSHAMLKDLSTCPEQKFELKNNHLLLQNHRQSQLSNLTSASHTFFCLGMWHDGEWWQLLGSAGKSLEAPGPPMKALTLGCPWRSAEFHLSNQKPIAHNVAKDQWKHTLAGMVQVKYVLFILLPWHSHKIWWK